MEIELPSSKGFTVYSKSGCPNCTLAKKHIKEKNFFYTEVNCDEYILENKEELLNAIQKISNVEIKTFPIVFYENKFIGGYADVIDFIDKLLLSFEDNF